MKHSGLGNGGSGALLSLPKGLKSVLGALFGIALTMFGLLIVTFLIGRVMPIDPVLAVVGKRASNDVYEAARISLGFDQPLYVQFWVYFKQILTGDFGQSLLTSNPVIQDIQRVFPATLELASVATIVGVVIGVPIGVYAAAYKESLFDQCVRVFGLFGYSMPVFWIGLIGLLIFYGTLGWVGGPGRLDIFYEDIIPQVTGMILIDSLLAGDYDIFKNAVSHIILPATILGYYSIAYISRMTRSFMLEQLSQEYITTARVKGMSEQAVIWRHAFRNVLIPLVTVIALSYANLLEGSVLTETIFAWPGLGQYITTSLLSADMNAVLGGTFVVGTLFVGLNIFSDFLYKVVDPRAR